VSSQNPESREKQAKALRERPKTPSHRKAISTALRHLHEKGELPASQPETIAKANATKQKNHKKNSQSCRDALLKRTTPEQRSAMGRRMLDRVKEKYGVAHPFDIPGVKEKATKAMSEAMSKRIASGKPTNTWERYKSGWHTSPIAGKQWYQGGWEQIRMQVLDAASVKWTKKHGIRIPYIDSKSRRRYYIPDFKIDCGETVVIEEVKGYKGKNYNLKCQAAREYCMARGWLYFILDSLATISVWEPPSNLMLPSET